MRNLKQQKKKNRQKLLKKSANIRRNNISKKENLEGYSLTNPNLFKQRESGSSLAVLNTKTNEIQYLDEMNWFEKLMFNSRLKKQHANERKLFDEYAKKKNSIMIHSSEFKACDCILCGSRIESIHDANNPWPLTDTTTIKKENGKENPNLSCNDCEEIVMSARVKSSQEGTHKDVWATRNNREVA